MNFEIAEHFKIFKNSEIFLYFTALEFIKSLKNPEMIDIFKLFTKSTSSKILQNFEVSKIFKNFEKLKIQNFPGCFSLNPRSNNLGILQHSQEFTAAASWDH